MGDAKRRKQLDPSFGVVSSSEAHYDSAIVMSEPDPVLVKTTVRLTTGQPCSVSLGRIFELSQSPNVSDLVRRNPHPGLVVDRYYSPVQISFGEVFLQGFAFFAPPYSNVRVGHLWIEVRGISPSQVNRIAKDCRVAIAAMLQARIKGGAKFSLH
jgi:hypothetical protein